MSISFFADPQTLNDLNIPGRHKNNSISRLFDTVITAGGRKLMDNMFQNPLTDANEINRRSSIFRYFENQAIVFPFTEEEFSLMENYLSSGSSGNLLSVGMNGIWKKVLQIVTQDKAYEELNKEVCKTIELLNRFYDFANKLQDQESPYRDQLELIKKTFTHPKLSWLKQEQGITDQPLLKLVKYDYQLRTGMYAQMRQLTQMIFHLDVYIAVLQLVSKGGLALLLPCRKEASYRYLIFIILLLKMR